MVCSCSLELLVNKMKVAGGVWSLILIVSSIFARRYDKLFWDSDTMHLITTFHKNIETKYITLMHNEQKIKFQAIVRKLKVY